MYKSNKKPFASKGIQLYQQCQQANSECIGIVVNLMIQFVSPIRQNDFFSGSSEQVHNTEAYNSPRYFGRDFRTKRE
jgi:hypothetical protein